jgi:hypothetical protein
MRTTPDWLQPLSGIDCPIVSYNQPFSLSFLNMHYIPQQRPLNDANRSINESKKPMHIIATN